MDIGGINRIKSGISSLMNKAEKAVPTSTDRDSQGSAGYQPQRKPTVLSAEQESEAIKKLNELPAFAQAGLKAELVKQEGVAPHLVVRKANGEVLRHLPYEQIIDIYLNRFSGNSTGRLLKSAA